MLASVEEISIQQLELLRCIGSELLDVDSMSLERGKRQLVWCWHHTLLFPDGDGIDRVAQYGELIQDTHRAKKRSGVCSDLVSRVIPGEEALLRI